MRSIVKWSIPIVLVGAAVWFVLSLGIMMPIDRLGLIETPAGPIEFRVVIFPDEPVRISTESPYMSHEIHLPRREIGRIYSEGRENDRLEVPLPGDADVSIRRSEDGSWHGFWTPPAGTRTSPNLPVSFFGREPREVSNDPGAVRRYEGRWRIQAVDSTSALLELYPLRDASGLVGMCSTFTGEFEFGGHADADGLRLTFFNGERAVAVRGRLEEGGTLSGEWWDSQRGMVSWTGERE
jgi:hypothetical protein